MTSMLGTITATLVSLYLLAPTAAAAARPNAPDCDAAVEAARAEIDAACPCAEAANHGQYVRCVTQKLRELTACAPGTDGKRDGKRACGPVPRQCAAKIRRFATRSACGKPAGTVTCCVPKQRDCVGDATPGDGQQDGTCAGTDRRCDRVTDCMVPRCEVAPNAERCALVGGTVGSGRNCATACK
jgi:hypothetical protein